MKPESQQQRQQQDPLAVLGLWVVEMEFDEVGVFGITRRAKESVFVCA